MKPRPFKPLVCYLLHFDRPVGRCRHYLGSTFTDRLETRLRHHAEGRGSRLTQRAVAEGTGFTVANVWPIWSRRDEARRKRSGHLDRSCPLCAGRNDLDGLLTFQADPIRHADWSGLSIER